MSDRVLRPRDRTRRVPKRYRGETDSDSPEPSTVTTPAMSQFNPTLTAAFPTLDFIRPIEELMDDDEAENENAGAEQRAALVFRSRRRDSDPALEEEQSNVTTAAANVNDGNDPGDWEDMELNIEQGKGENWDTENEEGAKLDLKEPVEWSSITPGIRIIILKEITVKRSILEAIQVLRLTPDDITELIEIREKELVRVTEQDRKMNHWNARFFAGEISSTEALDGMCKTDDGSPLEDPPGWINSKKDLKKAKRFLRRAGFPEIAAKMWEYHGVGDGRGFSPILYMAFPGDPEFVDHGSSKNDAPKTGFGNPRPNQKPERAMTKGSSNAQDHDDVDMDMNNSHEFNGAISGKDHTGLPAKHNKKKKISKKNKLVIGPSGLRSQIAADEVDDADAMNEQADLHGMTDMAARTEQTRDSITIATNPGASMTGMSSQAVVTAGMGAETLATSPDETQPKTSNTGTGEGGGQGKGNGKETKKVKGKGGKKN